MINSQSSYYFFLICSLDYVSLAVDSSAYRISVDSMLFATRSAKEILAKDAKIWCVLRLDMVDLLKVFVLLFCGYCEHGGEYWSEIYLIYSCAGFQKM